MTSSTGGRRPRRERAVHLAHLADLVHLVRDAYARRADTPGAAVRISAIRGELAAEVGDDAAADDAVTAALLSLADEDGVHLRAVADQKTLTAADRDAGVLLGGEVRHALALTERALQGRTTTGASPRAGQDQRLHDIEQLVRTAHACLSADPAAAVSISAIRAELAARDDGAVRDVRDVEVTEAIRSLAGQPGVQVRAAADPETLTDADRAAAVYLGGWPHHDLSLDQPPGRPAAGSTAASSPADTRPAAGGAAGHRRAGRPSPRAAARSAGAPSVPAGSPTQQQAPRQAGGGASHQQHAGRSAGIAGAAGPGSGETLDPAEARRFTGEVRAVAESLHTSLETSVTSLRERGVSGAPIELLTRMQHTAHALVVDADAAEAHFARHLALADQLGADTTLAAALTGTYLGAPGTAAPTPAPARRPTGGRRTDTAAAPGTRHATAPADPPNTTGPAGSAGSSAPSAPLGRPVPRTSVEDRIRAAYHALSPGPGSWVGLRAIRDQFDADDDEVTETLHRLVSAPGVHIVAEFNPRTLTQADHDAAVEIAGEPRDMMMIEDLDDEEDLDDVD